MSFRSKSCLQLRAIVTESPQLEYKIALARCGMQNTAETSHSVVQRLGALRANESAWQQCTWSPHSTSRIQDPMLWELYSGVWGSSKDKKSISFIQLPSSCRGIPRKDWTYDNGDSKILDFSFDSTTDLLAIMEKEDDSLAHYLRLKSLTNGSIHPLATGGEIMIMPHTNPHIADNERRWRYDIRTHGHLLGALFREDSNFESELDTHELHIWNWMTGQRLFFIIGTEVESFVFLTDSLVLVAEWRSSYMSHIESIDAGQLSYLCVYDITKNLEISLNDHNLDGFKPQVDIPFECCFLFPKEGFDTACRMILLSEPSPTWKHSGPAPFCIAEGERLIIVDHDYVDSYGYINSISFFIPYSTLLAHTKPENRGQVIYWQEWGPSGTYATSNLNSYRESLLGGGYVHGMRYIHPKVVRSSDPEAPLTVMIWDFHPSRAHIALQTEPKLEDCDIVPQPALKLSLRNLWYPSGMKTLFSVKQISVPGDIPHPERAHFLLEEDNIISLQVLDSLDIIMHFIHV